MKDIGSSSRGDGMATSVERADVLVVDVACTNDALSVTLSDGRTVTVPLAWFPRLVEASPRQRRRWELIGGGIGIHWDAVDEDISVASLLQPENFMRLPSEALRPTSRARRARSKARGSGASRS
jgi:hypothetical protein